MRTPEFDEVLVESACAVAWSAAAEALFTYADIRVAEWAHVDEGARQRIRKYVGGCLTGVSPADLHARWCDEQAAAGWTVGETFDEIQRRDPDLVVFEELAPAERMQYQVVHAVAIAYADALVPPRAP